MVDLNAKAAEFRKQGLGVATISYDSVAILKNFSDRKGISIPMLSDPHSQIIKAFGILNTNVETTSPVYGIPYPGTYIVNPRGVVKSKYFHDDYTERFSAGSMLTREFGENGMEKNVVDNPQITLTYSASDSSFAPGHRITLIIDVDPKPKMHVYAPGVKDGYIPIDWKMIDTPASVAYPVVYPDSHMLHLPAINETVPVYDNHIRLLRDIIIGQEKEIASALSADRSLSVEGKFRYQACDDRECYIPKEIPLKWTFKIGQLESERVPPAIRKRP